MVWRRAFRIFSAMGLVGAAACDAPTSGTECSRAVVLRPAPVGGWLGFAGEPLTMTFDQPTLKCLLDPQDIRASAELISPDETRTAATPLRVTYLPSTGASTADVTFTPNRPGLWQVIVTFEPALGRVQTAVPVVEDRSARRRVTLTPPFDVNACNVQPWRTTAGAVLCERDGRVLVWRPGVDGGSRPPADGGVSDEDFDGRHLVVDGNVLWSSVDKALTRRTDTGAGLVVDGRIELPVLPAPTPGYSTQDVAIRPLAFAGTAAVRVEFRDGGLQQSKVPTDLYDRPVFEDDAGTWAVVPGPSDDQLCPANTLTQCRSLHGRLVAHDRAGLWVTNGSSSPRELRLTRKPLRVTGADDTTLAFTDWVIWPYQSRPLVAEERVVMRSATTERSVVVHTGNDGQMALSWYGVGAVLGTRNNGVVLQPTSTTLSFVEF